MTERRSEQNLPPNEEQRAADTAEADSEQRRSTVLQLEGRIAELEAENERLRREVAALRKRLSPAKRGNMSTKLTEALRE